VCAQARDGGLPRRSTPGRAAMRSVAAVVLSYNGEADTLACLRSLAELRAPALARTIVVDNASIDSTVAAVREKFPHVELIVNPRNLGFSEGNNAGIRRALEHGSDWVLILNNDTVVAPDALDRLLAASVRHPGAGILSPLIFFMEPPDLVWFAGADFDPRRGYSGRLKHYRRPLPPRLDVTPTDHAVGAAMLISRAALEAVGAFDPDYFLLYEDVDLSLRVREGGFEVLLVPDARVWHRVSAAHAGRELTPLTSYYATRNNLLVCQRHAPLFGPAAWRREIVCLATHLAGLRRAHRPAASLQAVAAGLWDYRRGRFGARG
jgi:GT2 family glycosyltransferase